MAGTFPMTTVILLRHADRNVPDPDDPDPHLNQAGKKRAQVLPHVIGKSGVKAVYTSSYIRTQETARPFLDANPGLPAMQMDEASEIKDDILSNRAGQTVLVVGHSDSVPDLINQLGGGIVEIKEKEYDNLFVLTVVAIGKAKVVRLKYGSPS